MEELFNRAMQTLIMYIMSLAHTHKNSVDILVPTVIYTSKKRVLSVG